MPLNEYRYLKKTDKGKHINLATGQPKEKKKAKYTPYYAVKDGRRLTGSEVKRHEIVLTEKGKPIPNPMATPGIISLLPTSLYDLAFETLLTGMSYAEGVDPRVAIVAGLAAGKVAPKLPSAVKAANIKSGAYLTRRAVDKGFEAVKRDPMLADIPFEKVSKFLPKTGKTLVSGSYWPHMGKNLMRSTGPPFVPVKRVSQGWEPVFTFQEQSLLDLLASSGGFSAPTIFKRRWGESVVRHEGRHYKQNVEGLRNKIRRGNLEAMERPLTGGVAGLEYSTLINIPQPKNWKKIIPKKYIDSKGSLKSAEIIYEEALSAGKSTAYAKKYLGRYKKNIEDYEYVTRHIEVEARIEEISSLGKKNWHAYRDLTKRAGFTKNQVEDMVSDYRMAKFKKYPYVPQSLAEGITKLKK